MTDLLIFKKLMEWMNMEVEHEELLEDGNTLIRYSDTHTEHELFTKVGYDEFYSGGIFTPDGKMVKGYLDSHVAYGSDNGRLIDNLSSQSRKY